MREKIAEHFVNIILSALLLWASGLTITVLTLSTRVTIMESTNVTEVEVLQMKEEILGKIGELKYLILQHQADSNASTK